MRALVLAALLTVATYLGIIRLGFIRICWLPYVVPPVPALLALLILQGVNLGLTALVRRHRMPSVLHPLSRGELFLIYMGICVSLSMDRGGYILHYLMFPQYYGTDANQWQEVFSHYPSYYIPQDPAVIRGFFEGTPTGQIPLQAWAGPLAWWGVFNLLLMFAVIVPGGPISPPVGPGGAIELSHALPAPGDNGRLLRLVAGQRILSQSCDVDWLRGSSLVQRRKHRPCLFPGLPAHKNCGSHR